MATSGTSVPKRELISLIMRIFPENQIRELLKIQEDTDLRKRVADFPKTQILKVIQTTEDGCTALEETKTKYPFASNPTLYLISVNYWPEFQHLLDVTTQLAEQMREVCVNFGPDRTIRSVYMITPAREYHIDLPFHEIPFTYEKKIDYVVADPDSDDYGETATVYSLEKAIVWYCREYKHALLLCGDFLAVKPIMYYGRTMLDISWQLPYLSEGMLRRLAEGANPRTASFTRIDDDPIGNFDAQSLTVSDQSLGELRSYRSLTNDLSRQQTFGFYSSHPDLAYGSLGISRQYGRIWTPAHLRKDTLFALSMSLIQKTEQELNREADVNLNGFITYYRNVPIKLGVKNVQIQQRIFIEELVKAIIVARKSPTLESQMLPGFVGNLIEQYQSIDIVPALEVYCEHCGSYLARCSICNNPLIPASNENQLLFRCATHMEQEYKDNQNYVCECGTNIELTFSTDIRIFPGTLLLKAIHKFTDVLEHQQYDGNFIIIGNVLRLLPRHRAAINEFRLSDFRMWQDRAHIHQRNIPEKRKEQYRQILWRIKEKCVRNNRHSSEAICGPCLQEQITAQRIKAGDDLCLSRLFGFAIDERFDGVHHGREVADVQYRDTLQNSGEDFFLGIHLKSRERPRPRGLGRSISSIKGLFTQYCHSAYLATLGGENLNVIGISIPNGISDEVRGDFHFIAGQFGYPLIIIEEEDWLRVLDAAIEKATFE